MLNRRIVVTGGHGFLGRHVMQELKDKGYENVFTFSSTQFNLGSSDKISRMLLHYNPEIIIHLAANCGGIGYNQENPAKLFYDNAIMGIQLMHYSYVYGVKKFVQIGTVCSYPKLTYPPFYETDLWEGYPEETNAPYGLAKKMLLVQAQAYRQQYGFNAIYLIPANLYGPYDNFDDNKSHVIPAMIKKFDDAIRSNQEFITFWGSGEVSREFLYVKDAAKGIVLATEKYDKPEPINLGTGNETFIFKLAKMIGRLMGFKGYIKWDKTNPDGQPKRKLSVYRAQEEFEFKAETKLEIGLRETIEWYKTREG